MKISIWRQFSSNHSGSFTVIGRFPTESAAGEAAEKLASVIQRIDDWHADPANEAFFIQESMDNLRPLTAAEAAIAKEFDIEWEEQGVDWYDDAHSPVNHRGRDVFFNVPDTWCIPDPIANLLKKFGGETYQQHEFGGPITTILISLTCAFEGKERAAQISALFGRRNFDDGNSAWANDYDLYSQMASGKITQNGEHLRLDLDSGVEVLPVIIDWLKSQGAQDINYTFETRHDATQKD